MKVRERKRVLHSYMEDYDPFDPEVQAAGKRLMEKHSSRLPQRIRNRFGSKWDGEAIKASSVGWRDALTPRRVLAADGTEINTSTAETIMCPDFTFAADYMEIGDAFKYTLLFDWATVVTTPGTVTFRLRWGGVGGTALATSGVFAPDPTSAGTTLSGMLEYFVVCRAVGATTASFFCMGNIELADYDDASATTLKNGLDMAMIPTSAPAAVGSLDTSTAKALSPTVQFSISQAGNRLLNHIALLESLN